MAEYIEREALQKLMYEEAFEKDSDMQRWDSGCWIRYKLFENCIEAIPAADVVGVPEWMTKDELLDILRAAREGRLKITAPPIETTCGSCRHFQPYPGMASGKCDCRMKRNRRGQPTGEVLYVTQSHKACRDDYERRDGGQDDG